MIHRNKRKPVRVRASAQAHLGTMHAGTGRCLIRYGRTIAPDSNRNWWNSALLQRFKPYLWDFPNIIATICCSIACSRVRCKRCGEKSTEGGAGNSLVGDVYLLIGLFEGASWEHSARVFPSNKVTATSGANTLARLYPLFLIPKATGATTPQDCSY